MNWINKKINDTGAQMLASRTNRRTDTQIAWMYSGAVTIFAFLLFLFLFLFLPATAHAQSGLGANDNFSISNSEIKYETLAQAAAAVKADGTITMLQDVTASKISDFTLSEPKTYTINFANKTLASNAYYAIKVSAGTVTVKNGAVTNDINVNGGELIVESGTYSGTDDAIFCNGTGKATIKSGSFSCSIGSDGCLATSGGGQIVIADGSTANPANWAAENATSVTVARISTGIDNITGAKAIVSESYYDLTGKPAAATAKGFVIKRTVYDDGSVVITKNYEL